MSLRYFEDLAAGQKFSSPPLRVEAAEIRDFAAQFDPQPFHLDDEAARHSPLFGGLAASGWHTAAMTMRMCLASDFRPAGGIIGIGGELNWLKPVRSGDELHVEMEIVETRHLALAAATRHRQGPDRHPQPARRDGTDLLPYPLRRTAPRLTAGQRKAARFGTRSRAAPPRSNSCNSFAAIKWGSAKAKPIASCRSGPTRVRRVLWSIT